VTKLYTQSNKENTTEKGRRAFSVFATFVVIQILAYGYLVNASVGHVVGRMALEKRTDELSSSVAVLESKYFALQNEVTIETANSMQYINAAHVQYVDANGEPIVMLTKGN
jgi:hypothetical protein